MSSYGGGGPGNPLTNKCARRSLSAQQAWAHAAQAVLPPSGAEDTTQPESSLTSVRPPVSAGVYILIAVGALMMLVGFLGCYGAIQESQCLLGTVSIFSLTQQKVLISFYDTWSHILFADL